MLVRGISKSARFNAVMVCVKLAAVLFVIGVGAFYINAENWNPFAPFGWTGLSFFGYQVSGQADAERRPGRHAGRRRHHLLRLHRFRRGLHANRRGAQSAARRADRHHRFLLVCTVLYIGVVAVLTGMVNYNQLDVNAPVSKAFDGLGMAWAAGSIAAAGVAGITSVLLVMMLSAPRVFLAMARDGLVPKKFFAAVHPSSRPPGSRRSWSASS